MSQAGYTPIQLYYSTTAAAAPSAGNLANGELAVNITDGKLFYKDNGGVVRVLATAAGSAGDVVGPGSSTDNALVRFDGTTGKLVQSSVGVLSDAGVLTGLTGLTSSGSITFSGLTSGRVTYAGTGGLLQHSANLTFDGTTLTANALTVSNAVTLSGGVANGVAYLNGSKVLTTGSALTFDGTTQALTAASGYGTYRVSGGSSGGAYFETYNNTGTRLGSFGSENGGDMYLGTRVNNPIIFLQNNAEAARLTSTGLGIGTSSPSTRLEVAGEASPILRLTSTSGPYSQIQSNTAGTLQLMADEGNTGASTSMRFRVDGAEVARFDSSGNLGLGVTPSAWGGVKAIESAFGNFAGVNQFNGTANAWYNGGNWVYKNTAAATQYLQISGAHQWLTAPSGTAGNAISFTQAMTLDASGVLLVGTTSSGGAGGMSVFPLGGGAGTSAIQIFNKTNTTSDSAILFRVAGATVSGISYTSTVVTYGTVSDHRLKEVVQPITDALARNALLNPVKYKWKVDGSDGEGFIAHELQGAFPTAVTGEKDAVDEEGKPVYQSVGTGPLDGHFAACINELTALVESLKAEVAALKAAA